MVANVTVLTRVPEGCSASANIWLHEILKVCEGKGGGSSTKAQGFATGLPRSGVDACVVAARRFWRDASAGPTHGYLGQKFDVHS